MNKKRIIYIDVIRITAMLLVVLAHSCATRLAQSDRTIQWSFSNVLVAITEIAVPLFFMISGATILNSKKTSSVSYLFRHRLIRIMLPFILWSIISVFVFNKLSGQLDLRDCLKPLIYIYHEPVSESYWFIYPLIGLYLLSPFLKKMVDSMDRFLFQYFLILWLTVSILLPSIANNFSEKFGMAFSSYEIGNIISSSSLGYFVLGYYLTKAKSCKNNTPLLIVALIILFLIVIGGRFIQFTGYYSLWHILSSLSIPILASLIFIIFKQHQYEHSERISKIVEEITPLTYGVYLSHGLIIVIVQRFINGNDFLIIFLVTTFVSLLLMWILNKIPYIRKLLL